MKKRTVLLYLILISSLLTSHNSVFSMKRQKTSEEANAFAHMVAIIPASVLSVSAIIDALAEVWIRKNPDPGTIIGRLRESGYSRDCASGIMSGIRNRAIIVSNRTNASVYFRVTLQERELSVIVPASQRCFLDLGQEVPSTGQRIQVYSQYEDASDMEGSLVFPPEQYIWIRGGDAIRLLPPAHYLNLHPIIQGPAQFQQ